MLQSLRHQTHTNFEIVVVADALPSSFVNHVKFIPFSTANISAARNAGIAHSAGEIIAFCDDDAIPDPPWLERLVSPFVSSKLGAAAGFTRGRNGISLQWGAMRFDRTGKDYPFEVDETQSFEIFAPSPDMPVKLIGTNMAFRKSALLEINGFDESFRFFLDETDAKLRLDQAGWDSAIAHPAQVHHNFATSERRAENRAPTDLFEIGASKAYFCKTHMEGEIEPALRDFTNEQLTRLTVLVEQHKLNRRDVTPLMETLANGISDGLERLTSSRKFTTAPSGFLRFKVQDNEHVVLCVRPRDGAWMAKTTRELINAGKCVSVIQLLRSPRYFQVQFKDGYWLHRGGAFGKSIRTQPLLQIRSYQQRFAAEIYRISTLYPVDRILTNPERNIQL